MWCMMQSYTKYLIFMLQAYVSVGRQLTTRSFGLHRCLLSVLLEMDLIRTRPSGSELHDATLLDRPPAENSEFSNFGNNQQQFSYICISIRLFVRSIATSVCERSIVLYLSLIHI